MRTGPVVSAILLVALGGCSREVAAPARPPATRAERQAALDRIAAECRVSRTFFTLAADDELRIQPGPDDAYERVECALRRVREANVRVRTMGFVGNELPAPEANNAQTH